MSVCVGVTGISVRAVIGSKLSQGEGVVGTSNAGGTGPDPV